MNGENGSAKENTPATGPSANGDAEHDDSDDEENAAPEAGATGGGLLGAPTSVMGTRQLTRMNFFLFFINSGKEEEEAQAKEEEGRREGPDRTPKGPSHHPLPQQPISRRRDRRVQERQCLPYD